MVRPAPPPLRVLFANPFPDLGGAELSLLSLLGTLPPSISPVLVTSMPGALTAEAARLGVETHCVRFPPLSRVGAFRPAVMALRAVVRGAGAEILHANSTRGAFFAGLAGREEGLPVLWHIREQLGVGPRTLLLRRVTQTWIGNSSAALRDSGVPVEHPSSRVVYNGLPLSYVRRDPRPVHPGPDHEIIVGMLGRVEPAKGQREFLEAAALIREGGLDARFVLGGGILGPAPGRKLRGARRYSRSLENIVRRNDLASRAEFRGTVTRTKPFYDALDILVVPSWREGFCRVVIEGMARGLPVVASRVGGIPEIITSGDNGWLVPPRDPVALARAVSFLIRNPESAAFLAARGRQCVLDRFLDARCTREIVAIYSEISGRSLEVETTMASEALDEVATVCT